MIEQEKHAERRAMVRQIIDGLNAVEARRTHYERFDAAKAAK